MSLSLTSAAALRAAADKLTLILIDRPTKFIKKRENESAAKTGFALTRLQRLVFIAARFYRLFYFPLPPCFSFSERPLWHGSSRKSTAEKLPRKTFIALIRNSSCMELFFVLRSLFRAYIGTNFSFLPLTCAN